jgi:NTE family protein
MHARAAGAFQARTAFVLSGDASLAAGQVGMLQALYERGVAPDVLIGTSAEALNAALVASRPQTTAMAKDPGRVWRNLRRKDIFPASVRAVVGGLSGRRGHLVPDRGLRQLVRRYMSSTTSPTQRSRCMWSLSM